MKAIISIAALAMTFASVLAQELRGGPAVSTCLAFYRINLSLSPNQTNSHFISASNFSFLSLAIDIILTH